MSSKQKIAVVFVHGMGKGEDDFSTKIREMILEKLPRNFPTKVIMQDVYWAGAFQPDEDHLIGYAKVRRLRQIFKERAFLINYLADVIAYQIHPKDRSGYDKVHKIFAETLKNLADTDGGDIPLIVVAHSLGSVIASNYFYDLQNDFQDAEYTQFLEQTLKIPSKRDHKPVIAAEVKHIMGDEPTPLERGETLIYFNTLGCPLAIYNMRYKAPDYGVPIGVPAPKLLEKFARLAAQNHKGWLNFFDKDDIIAYPLADLNDCYKTVVEDVEVDAGPFPKNLTLLSHAGYWECPAVIERVVQQLKAINELM
jgi:hypothetical protein